jgi:hypothetical protein
MAYPKAQDYADFKCDYSRDLRLAKWASMINLRCKHLGSPMSALGHKQTFRNVRAMSALHPKADIVPRDSWMQAASSFFPGQRFYRCGCLINQIDRT